MDFKQYFLQQMNIHPSIQPQDIVKLCFQAAYGAEHLLNDLHAAEAYLEKEYAAIEACNIPLYECISDHVCRVNLAAWKWYKLPLSWLFKMFASSSQVKSKDNHLFFSYLKTAEQVLQQTDCAFSMADWHTYLTKYQKTGISPVHHSLQYRAQEQPAYRIINTCYIRLFPLLKYIAGHLSEDQVYVIAIDGRAASGKSTMAGHLQTILDADVIHMDDFFLPPSLRTAERFATPGGNIHYERFLEEVLPHISKPEGFSYRIFDCGQMDYNGNHTVGNVRFSIVEGSYSCHPLFGRYANVCVFSDVNPQEQMHRILHRNGAEMAEIFQNNWIPLEEKYFENYNIASRADIWV